MWISHTVATLSTAHHLGSAEAASLLVSRAAFVLVATADCAILCGTMMSSMESPRDGVSVAQ
jgi:hypothetical protein